MRVRLQYRFLAKSLALLVIAGLIMFAVHGFQVGRQSRALLQRARNAAQVNEIPSAVRYYTQYLKARRDSIEARLEFAILLMEHGDPGRAFFFLEECLRLDPKLEVARRSLVKAALQIQRHADAKTHLQEHLLPAYPDEAELHWSMGICEQQLGEFESARQHLQKATDLDGRQPKYVADLAELLSSRFAQTAQAREILDRLVTNTPDEAAAFMARGAWLVNQCQRLSEQDNDLRVQWMDVAWSDAQRVLELQANQSASTLFFVSVALSRKEYARANDALQKALLQDLQEAKLHAASAQIALAQGNPEVAVRALDDGLKAIPGESNLLWLKAQTLLDMGQADGVPLLVEELRSREFHAPSVRFLESRILMAQGRWREAVRVLEEVRPQVDRSQPLLMQADLLAAQCYGKLENPDLEMAALRRALGINPLWLPAREALATALLRAGRVQESLTELAPVARQPSLPASVIMKLARIQFLDGLRRNASGDDWNTLRQTLSLLEAKSETADDAAILRAELLLAEGNHGQAQELLETRLQANPGEFALHQALISLHSRQQEWEKAQQAIDAAGASLMDTVPMRLEKALYLLRRYGKSADRGQLELLSIPRPDWSAQDKAMLAVNFVRFFMSVDEFGKAEELAHQVAATKEGRGNLSNHLLFFELALRSGKTDTLAESMEQVQRIEGQGPIWRVGEAIRLLIQTSALPESSISERESGFSKAMNHLSEAAVQRPAWPLIPRLKADILDRQKKLDLAADTYVQTIQLGEQSPALIARTISLLYQQGRYATADEVVRKLQETRTAFSLELTRLASQVSLKLENFDHALAIAKDRAQRTGAAEDHAWLAQVYAISGKDVEAEREFRVAIEKDSSVPTPWLSLVQLHARRGNTEAATQAIEDAEKTIRSQDRDGALAQAYQMVRNPAKAEEHFQRAIQENPKQVSLLRRYAEFCMLQERPNVAEPILEQLLKEDSGAGETDRAFARQSLALIVGGKGDESSFQRAKELIRTNTQARGQNPHDLRTLALILSTRPDKTSWLEAIGNLEQVVKQETSFSLGDHFLLANLYNKIGDWGRYSRSMRSVLGNGGASDSKYVRGYAQALIEKGELEEGQLWLSRLKGLAPSDLATATIEVRLLMQSGDLSKLRGIIEQQAADSDHRLWAAQTAEGVGAALQEQGKLSDASPFLDIAKSQYTEMAKADPKQSLAVAAFHARRAHFDALLESLGPPGMPADQLSEVVQFAFQTAKLDPESTRKLIAIVQAVKGQDPKSPSLDLALGDLWSWLGEGEEASTAYQRVLESDPRNIAALNNLAMILGLTGRQLDRANQAIDQAVRVYGASDILLDTRGVVQLAAGRAAAAEQDFRKSIAQASRADRWFHLAQALLAQNRQAESREALQKSQELGLQPHSLHTIERTIFERMIQQQ